MIAICLSDWYIWLISVGTVTQRSCLAFLIKGFLYFYRWLPIRYLVGLYWVSMTAPEAMNEQNLPDDFHGFINISLIKNINNDDKMIDCPVYQFS